MKNISLKEHLDNIRPALNEKLRKSGHHKRIVDMRWKAEKEKKSKIKK